MEDGYVPRDEKELHARAKHGLKDMAVQLRRIAAKFETQAEKLGGAEEVDSPIGLVMGLTADLGNVVQVLAQTMSNPLWDAVEAEHAAGARQLGLPVQPPTWRTKPRFPNLGINWGAEPMFDRPEAAEPITPEERIELLIKFATWARENIGYEPEAGESREYEALFARALKGWPVKDQQVTGG